MNAANTSPAPESAYSTVIPTPTFAELRDAAAALRESTRLNLLPTLSRLSAFGAFPAGRLAL